MKEITLKKVKSRLFEAGWTEGRTVDISSADEGLTPASMDIPICTRDFIHEFHGIKLTIDKYHICFNVTKGMQLCDSQDLQQIKLVFGGRWFPVGYSPLGRLVMSEYGAVLDITHDWHMFALYKSHWDMLATYLGYDDLVVERREFLLNEKPPEYSEPDPPMKIYKRGTGWREVRPPDD